MLAVIISATITITDVCNSTYKLIAEWNNIHKTPLSESHQIDQKEPKVETGSSDKPRRHLWIHIADAGSWDVDQTKRHTGRRSVDSGINWIQLLHLQQTEILGRSQPLWSSTSLSVK